MSTAEGERVVTVKEPGTPEKSPGADPSKVDKKAEDDLKKKYGFKKAPPGIAQRKISSAGGKQYFDSGDYNMSDRKEEIASHPHARNPRLLAPHMAPHLRPRGVPPAAQPSKLTAAGRGKSPLAD